jgi:hypothetical protein
MYLIGVLNNISVPKPLCIIYAKNINIKYISSEWNNAIFFLSERFLFKAKIANGKISDIHIKHMISSVLLL